MTKTSPFMSEGSSPIGDGSDQGSKFLSLWPLPPPLPPIDANIIGILKMLSFPSQMSKHKTETDNANGTVPSHDNNDHSIATEWLRRSLNQSVDPCEDFYGFTCGKWLADNPKIPAGEMENSHFSQLTESTKHKLYDVFIDRADSTSNAINLAKSMFGACMKYERKKPSTLLERINEFGGWPLLAGSQWDPGCFNLPHVLAKIRRSMGSCYFFPGICHIFMGTEVEQMPHNASQQAIYFYQNQLGLGRIVENYRNATKLEEYSRRIMHIVKVLASDAGIEFCDEKIGYEVDKIVNFEKELANITKQYNSWKEMRESFKVHRFRKLAKILPELNLTEYFNALLPINRSFHEYFASDPEVLYDDIYFEKLSSLLAKTNKTTLANFVMLRYVMEWSNKHLDDRLEPKKAKTSDKLGMDCVQWVEQELRYASGAMYVRKHFGNDSKNAVLEMIENIRTAFRKMLSQNTWMDPITRKRAISKLAKVIPQVGFPDFYLNDSQLDAYYNELKFDANDSFSSMWERTTSFNTAKGFQKLLAPRDRNEFDFKVYLVNGYFETSLNVIRFPVAILQAPYFDYSFPKAMNYGGIGMIIGHEFTHGFDDLGSEYDEFGNEENWWEPDTKANFQKQKKCLIDEYSAYRVPETNTSVNGTRTEFENQADNGGIKEAYMAYQTYLKKLGHKEVRLIGFENFTNEQLFFINFGIVWCGKNAWKHDSHSPNRYRVNGPLPNLPEFAAAFNCPKGSPMNPVKKCRVW